MTDDIDPSMFDSHHGAHSFHHVEHAVDHGHHAAGHDHHDHAQDHLGRFIDDGQSDMFGHPLHHGTLADGWSHDTTEWFNGGQTWEHFDPSHAHSSHIVGDPAAEMSHWHQQTYTNSCAVASQEFILNSMGDHHYQETDLVRDAFYHGWFDNGTPLLHVGDLLEEHGVSVHRDFGCTLKDLSHCLEHHEKVIVGVQAAVLKSPATANLPLTEYAGIPSQFANHAVQVIGIDNTDPAHPKVILDDPGRPDGKGIMIPAEQFDRAWAPSGHFMMSTTMHSAQPAPHAAAANQPQAGHYNAHGTYHPKALPVLGSWEKGSYSGCFYERRPDGSYTGNWAR
jgi:hypothetical protein